MQYKLVVLDIDGTMLSSQAELSPRVRQSIEAVRERGIKVTLATGRRVCRSLPWARAFNLTIPIVAHNGAVVVDSQTAEICFQKGIYQPIANELISELTKLHIPHLVYSGEDYGDMGMLPSQFKNEKISFITYIDDELKLTDSITIKSDPVKIAVLAKEKIIQPILNDWQIRYGKDTNMVVYQSEQYIGVDFIAAGCSKASGVKYILDKLQLNYDQVLAIGDDYNDIELIKAAGLGVAVANAPEAVRKQAQYIAPSNDEDGIAHVLQEFCL